MPTIQPYEQRTSAGGAGFGPGPVAQASDRGMVVRAVGESLESIMDDRRRIERADAVSQVVTTLPGTALKWRTRFLELQEQAEPGAPDFTPTFMAEIEKDKRTILATAKNPFARRFLEEQLGQLSAELGTEALAFEAGTRIKHRRSQAESGIALAATASELDPDRYQVRLAEQLASIDELALSPTDRAALRQQALDTVVTRTAGAYARRDPMATMQRLVQPEEGDTLFRALTPAQRDAVMAEVEGEQRRRITAENLAFTRAQRLEIDAQNSASKEGDRLLYAGALTPGWIERNRAVLSEDDYRYFYRAMSGEGDAPRNPLVYADLRERASLGQDVRMEAKQAVRNGQIGRGDYDRLLSEVEATRPGWFKRGTQFIVSSSGYSDLNPTPAAGQVKANMLEDWREWADQNPKAPEEQAAKAYRQIVRDYALVDLDKLTLTMRKPLYLVGGHSAPDIEATEAATVVAYDAKEIDEAEFNRQAELIAQWRAVLSRVQKTAP